MQKDKNLKVSVSEDGQVYIASLKEANQKTTELFFKKELLRCKINIIQKINEIYIVVSELSKDYDNINFKERTKEYFKNNAWHDDVVAYTNKATIRQKR